MKCPRCGNEVQQGEVFCGQCGAPNAAAGTSAEAMSSQAPQSGALPEALATNQKQVPFPPNAGLLTMRPRTLQLPAIGKGGSFAPPAQAPAGTPPPQQKASSGQGTGFHQEATEAMSYAADGGVANYPQLSPSRPLPQGPSKSGGLLRSGQFAASNPTPVRPPYAAPGYEHGLPIRPALPPQKQQNGPIVLIICVCVIVGLISVIGIIVSLTNNHTAPAGNTQINPGPTTGVTATAVPSPTPTPSPGITPTPTPIPTPTLPPTPAPDNGFAWCGPSCTNYGFVAEYPLGWQLGGAPAGNGVQFINPAQPDEIATFLATGPTSNTASAILNNELATMYASKPGYRPPAPATINTIAGETWTTALIYYQSASNPQMNERVIIFATVHNAKGYLIELQAPDPQFDAVNAASFQYMVARYQFVQQQ